MAVRHARFVQRLPSAVARPAESALHVIGPISLDAKRAGKRSAGNPPAPFDGAGAGNGVTVGSTRARTGKPGTQTRSRPHGLPRQFSTLPGEGPGWATAPGYSTAANLINVRVGGAISRPCGAPAGRFQISPGGGSLSTEPSRPFGSRYTNSKISTPPSRVSKNYPRQGKQDLRLPWLRAPGRVGFLYRTRSRNRSGAEGRSNRRRLQ